MKNRHTALIGFGLWLQNAVLITLAFGWNIDSYSMRVDSFGATLMGFYWCAVVVVTFILMGISAFVIIGFGDNIQLRGRLILALAVLILPSFQFCWINLEAGYKKQVVHREPRSTLARSVKNHRDQSVLADVHGLSWAEYEVIRAYLGLPNVAKEAEQIDVYYSHESTFDDYKLVLTYQVPDTFPVDTFDIDTPRGLYSTQSVEQLDGIKKVKLEEIQI
jgi:uncharacterized membrane protein YqjE